MASKNEVVSGIKQMGWSAIKLTQKGYRGAVQTYRTAKGEIVPVMYYLHEAFVVEDKQGLFGVQDLVYGLMDQKGIDLEGTGHIVGLSLVAYQVEEGAEAGEIKYMDETLTRLGINTEATRTDLKHRLAAVSRLAEMVDVPMD